MDVVQSLALLGAIAIPAGMLATHALQRIGEVHRRELVLKSGGDQGSAPCQDQPGSPNISH